MQISLYDSLVYFLIYSFLGWCMEVTYYTVDTGTFINRGFLNGPLCPVYGFGGIGVLLGLMPLKDRIFTLFLASMLIATAIEYVTGYILEKVFHGKWWDYSEYPFNVNGYVCVRFSLAWGFVCVFMVKIIHPLITTAIHFIPHALGIVLISVCYAIVIADIIVTVIVIKKLKTHIGRIEELEKGLRVVSDGIGEKISDRVLVAMKKTPDFEATLEEFQQRYKRLLEHRENRLLKAFPNLADMKLNKPLERIKNLMSAAKDKSATLREKSLELTTKTMREIRSKASRTEVQSEDTSKIDSKEE